MEMSIKAIIKLVGWTSLLRPSREKILRVFIRGMLGKFMELLENEIKVLKTCDNKNIIKLYDIKKTANNFYLIMEYCNEGDLAVFLKKKKTMAEDQAI